ncbi:unnamed protein product [Soboliphyme baturini]|uniref:Glycosyltransferase family 92 protein n=1 Tax=Soboliphyme baturini TaxID=241478 RepID=A0A183J7N8_9BILA|nr:unnamed protein product [Soboliphyme baturini]
MCHWLICVFIVAELTSIYVLYHTLDMYMIERNLPFEFDIDEDQELVSPKDVFCPDHSLDVVPTSSESNRSPEDPLTVVTAFIDIGSFQKNGYVRPLSQYRSWFRLWRNVHNPVVLFYNKAWICRTFRAIRGNLTTRYIRVDLSREGAFWSSKLRVETTKIFSDNNYPKHYPSTTNVDYVVVMHAKYDFVEYALQRNFFRSSHFAWIDIGLFRDYDLTQCFRLQLPPHFDETKVAFGKVQDFRSNQTAEQIIRSMPVWLCGCIFVGSWSVLQRFVVQYRDTVNAILRRKLVGDDQMTLYSMFADKTLNISITVPIQWYETNYELINCDRWFCLAYVMRVLEKCI